MKIIFCVYGLRTDNLRLQPWRYVYEMAKRLPELGWSTTIVTDTCAETKNDLKDVTIRDCVPLSPFAKNSILRLINKFSPDVILWPLGAKSIAYVPILRKLKARIIGYIPGPILDIADCYSACRAKLPSESLLAISWILARTLKWGRIMSTCCERLIVLSEENRNTMIKMGIEKRRIHVVTAGCDSFEGQLNNMDIENLSNKPKTCTTAKIVLYMGWPTRVRGIDLLLDAFSITSSQNGDLNLTILARGENTTDHQRLRSLISAHPACERITVIEGFLPKKDVLKHISECDFGVLPFIQVPADRPLSFLEFFAAGKPVVSTDASGIPELIEDKRGKVSKRNNPKNLAVAMLQMAELPDTEFEQYKDDCINFIGNYPDWDESALKLAKILET